MKRACPVSEANSSSATDTGKMRVILLGLEGTAALDVWSALRARITERKSLQMAQRILVVEDEPAISESVAYALKRDGFSVVTAATIAEAETQLDTDLVVLDLMLPDGSGFDLIGKLRRDGDLTPIIVLSSRDGEADRVAALETGADDYVPKPFSPREVVARVRAVLRRARPSRPPDVKARRWPSTRLRAAPR